MRSNDNVHDSKNMMKWSRKKQKFRYKKSRFEVERERGGNRKQEAGFLGIFWFSVGTVIQDYCS